PPASHSRRSMSMMSSLESSQNSWPRCFSCQAMRCRDSSRRKSSGVYPDNADRQNAGLADKNPAGPASRLVKLQRPPPEMRIFSASLAACSTSTTFRPRWPATAAHIMPAAPAPMMATSNRSVLDQAIDVVAHVSRVGLVFRQAMDIGFEAGEAGVEFTRELQVLHDGAVEALSRDQ